MTTPDPNSQTPNESELERISALIDGDKGLMTGKMSNGDDYQVNIPKLFNDRTAEIASEGGVEFDYAEVNEPSVWSSLLLNLLPKAEEMPVVDLVISEEVEVETLTLVETLVET